MGTVQEYAALVNSPKQYK